MKPSKKTLTIILIGLAIADFLGAIDSTGVNIALPTITKDLSIPIILAQWIPNAYTLALVGTLIFMGKIGDIIGPKKLYLIGLSLFGLTSLTLGFINNPSALIAVRALQGLGTAILYTMPMAIIAHLWQEREKAFAVTASFFAGGMLIGPLIGGFFTSLNLGNFFGWHLLFLLNIPFIIFGLIVAGKFIPKIEPKIKTKIDFFSLLLLFAGLFLIVASFSMISKWYIIAGLTLLVLLYIYEKKLKNPLLDLKLFRDQTFTAANLVSFFAMITIIGMSFVLTFYLQDILKWNSLQAGLAFLPVPLATGIAAALSGRLKNWKIGAFLSSGLILAGILLLTQVNPGIAYFYLILPAMILIAGGSGVLMTVMFAAILGSAPTEKSGSASGILNTLQQMGGLIGIALVAAIVLNYKLSFGILVVMALAGFLAAFFV
ncbi:MAG: MFS transporter, partial [Patescibacteria group bacterium]